MVSTIIWHSLERRAPAAFIVAGVLLLASPGHLILEQFTEIVVPVWWFVLLVMPGLMASIVGLLGLYPRLAEHGSRMAFVGAGCASLAGLTVLVLVGWTVTVSLLQAVTELPFDVVPPGFLFLALTVTIALGSVLLGLAILLTSAGSHTVGVLLLAFGTPWIVILGLTPVYGSAIPNWIALSVYGTLPVAMLATGYVQRRHSPFADHSESPANVVAE